MNISFVRFIYLSILLVSLLMGCLVEAQSERESDPGYIFYKANALYEDGKYDKAIKVYESMLEQGMESGSLYYNMGNSYFKAGALGKAILYYERARKLIPGDSDLKSNYEYARSKTKTPVISGSVPIRQRTLNLFRGVSINGLTIMLSIVFIMLLSAIFIFFIVKPDLRYRYVITLSISLFLIITSFALLERISALDREAVLISERSEVTFEPIDSATVHYTLYEGEKVYIIQKKKEWYKIRRDDGKVGWINKDVIEII